MIYLNEVCEKLDEILNGSGNPTDFYYDVQTVGFHLDKVYDKSLKRDTIMVFVSSMGGSFNPVYGLGQSTATIPITIYFPVRFKEDIFALDAFLHDTFVGANLTYGALSGNAISNLSVSQYGEIVDLDLKEFKEWTEQVYKKPIEVMEPYMSLTLNLYLSSIGADYLYANTLKVELTSRVNVATGVINDGDLVVLYRFEPLDEDRQYIVPAAIVHFKAFIDENFGVLYMDTDGTLGVVNEIFEKKNNSFLPIGAADYYSPTVTSTIGWSDVKFASGSLQQHAQSTDQQVMGEYKSEGLPFSATNGQSFSVFMDKKSNYFLYAYWYGILPYMEFDLRITSDEIKIDLERKVFIQSFNMPIDKGQPLAATITLADRMEA